MHGLPELTGKIRAELGIAPGSTVLLYAPTHRDYRRGFVPRLGLERLSRELGPGFTLLVRAHYFYGRPAGTEAGAGSSTSPRTPSSRNSSWPPTG